MKAYAVFFLRLDRKENDISEQMFLFDQPIYVMQRRYKTGVISNIRVYYNFKMLQKMCRRGRTLKTVIICAEAAQVLRKFINHTVSSVGLIFQNFKAI